MKKALHIVIDKKAIDDAKSIAIKFNLPLNKIIEIALKQFIDSEPAVLKINANSSK